MAKLLQKKWALCQNHNWKTGSTNRCSGEKQSIKQERGALSGQRFILSQNIEWIGLSFVRTAKDVVNLKKLIKQTKAHHKVIAKIEKPEEIRNINTIVRETDAIMVARGDLGVEVPHQKVPVYQKMIVEKCINNSKPVVIATQMLESMVDSPSATRAEVNDVANSVIDGAHAGMLSGETSVGKNPVKVVETMRGIIRDIEKSDYTFMPKSDNYVESWLPKDRQISNSITSICPMSPESIFLLTLLAFLTGHISLSPFCKSLFEILLPIKPVDPKTKIFLFFIVLSILYKYMF